MKYIRMNDRDYKGCLKDSLYLYPILNAESFEAVYSESVFVSGEEAVETNLLG